MKNIIVLAIVVIILVVLAGQNLVAPVSDLLFGGFQRSFFSGMSEGLEQVGYRESATTGSNQCPPLTLPACTVSPYHPYPDHYSCEFSSTDFGDGFSAQFVHNPDNVVWCKKGTAEGENVNYCYVSCDPYKWEIKVTKQQISGDGVIGQKQEHVLALTIDLKDGKIVEWHCC